MHTTNFPTSGTAIIFRIEYVLIDKYTSTLTECQNGDKTTHGQQNKIAPFFIVTLQPVNYEIVLLIRVSCSSQEKMIDF